MNDRELLELAAKAAGVEVVTPMMIEWDAWNPLDDDGDALRLAVKLDMNIYSGHSKMIVEIPSDGDCPNIVASEKRGDESLAATRRAIVRAAAEIGKEMK